MYNKGNYLVTSESDKFPVGVLQAAELHKQSEVLHNLELMLSEHFPEDTIDIDDDYVVNKHSWPTVSLRFTATSQNEFDAHEQAYKWYGVVEMEPIAVYNTSELKAKPT